MDDTTIALAAAIGRIHKELEIVEKLSGLAKPGPRKKAADPSKLPADNSRITAGLRSLVGMFCLSGSSSRVITKAQADWFHDRGETIGWKTFKAECQLIMRFYAWRLKHEEEKHGPYVWKKDFQTAINNWNELLDRADEFLQRFGDAPGVKTALPRLPKPVWGADENGYIWKQKYEEIYGSYPSVEWDMLTPKMQQEIINRGKK